MAEGYTQPSFRTEYEYIVPYRVTKLFAYMAEDDGKVTEITNKIITVTYKDSRKVTAPLGRHYGVAEGSTYPHDIITPLKPNMSFKKGDCISYNTGFFEPDWLNSKNILLKTNMSCTTAMAENNEVFEDSSALSTKMAKRMTTNVTKVRSFIIEFDKNIVNIMEPGVKVKPEDTLFLITDESGMDTALSEDTIMLLNRLANVAPKAKVIGTLDKYEILYNGDINDMSPSLRKLTNKLNANLALSTKGMEEEIKDGSVNSEYRVNGKNLQIDTLELKVYITVSMPAGVGDKGVFAAQMKSIFGDIFSHNVTTESGTNIDAFFGQRSIAKRVVMSPLIMGTTNRLLYKVSKDVAEAYFG